VRRTESASGLSSHFAATRQPRRVGSEAEITSVRHATVSGVHRKKPAIRGGLKSREESVMKTQRNSTTTRADVVCRD